MTNHFINLKRYNFPDLCIYCCGVHWLIFLLVVGIPVVALMALPAVTAMAQKDTYLAMTLLTATSLLSTLLSMSILLNWLYAIGSGLQPYLPETARSTGMGRLRLFMLMPIIYVACITIYMIGFSFKRGAYLASIPGAAFAITIMAALLLHLFSMFCIFYCLYVAARTLRATELKRPVTFGDFVGEFFLMWFFPVGVWIIQPRINKIIAREPENNMDIFKGSY